MGIVGADDVQNPEFLPAAVDGKQGAADFDRCYYVVDAESAGERSSGAGDATSKDSDHLEYGSLAPFFFLHRL